MALFRFKNFLGDKLIKHTPTTNIAALNNLDCWTLSYSAFDVDAFYLIKGIIPVTLTQIINDHTHNISKTRKWLRKGLHQLQNDLFNHIWKDRCLLFKVWKSKKGITAPYSCSPHLSTTTRKKYTPVRHSFTNLRDAYTASSYQTWMREAILYGFSWKDL